MWIKGRDARFNWNKNLHTSLVWYTGDMQTVNIWRNSKTWDGSERVCLTRSNGDFVRIKDGAIFSKDDHYCEKQFKARIKAVDQKNETGMYHLDEHWSDNHETNAISRKSLFLDCIVTVVAAHMCGGTKVYRCIELDNEYFSENELELLEPDDEAWKAYRRGDVA